MAEESKQTFDPEATVAQPIKPARAPPIRTRRSRSRSARRSGGDRQPVRSKSPTPRRRSPARQPSSPTRTRPTPAFDPEATDRRRGLRSRSDGAPRASPRPGAQRTRSRRSRRRRPSRQTCPRSAALNPLVAMANPILAAVPQIRRTLQAPRPGGAAAPACATRSRSWKSARVSGEIRDDTLNDRGLRALRAARRIGGRDALGPATGSSTGLLQAMRGESGGARRILHAAGTDFARTPKRTPTCSSSSTSASRSASKAAIAARRRPAGAPAGTDRPVRPDRAPAAAPRCAFGALAHADRASGRRCRAADRGARQCRARRGGGRAATPAPRHAASAEPVCAVALAAARDLERRRRHRRRLAGALHAGTAPAGRRVARRDRGRDEGRPS